MKFISQTPINIGQIQNQNATNTQIIKNSKSDKIQFRRCIPLQSNQNISQNPQNYQLFYSLAGKIITRRRTQEYLIIKFPSKEMYLKFLKNYKILKNFLKVPTILKQNQDQQFIVQQFIQSQQHSQSFTQCLQYLQIIQKIKKINSRSHELPILKFNLFVDIIIINIKQYWNKFTHSYQINQQQITTLQILLQQLSTRIDNMPKTTIYRDLNLTNILRSKQNNQLYLIDFQNLSEGPYLTDLCFILIDKYFYFNDAICLKTIHKYCVLFNQKQCKFMEDFSVCSYFLNLQWLIQMIAIYYKKQIHFHMNLRILIIQLLRSTHRLQKYINKDIYEKLYNITNKLFKGYIEGYNKLTIKYNLPLLVNKISIQYIVNSKQNNLYNKSKQSNKKISKIIDNEELKINLRKKWIQLQFKLHLSDEKCKQLFNSNCIFKGILKPYQKRIMEFRKWYFEQYNQNRTILYQLLNEIFKVNEDKVYVRINNKQIYQMLIRILPQNMLQIHNNNNNNNNNSNNINISIQSQNKQLQMLNKQQYSSEVLEQLKYKNSNNNCYSAIILAAGQGSRLGYKHKALINIHGKSLLQYWIQKLVKSNVSQIIIADLNVRTKAIENVIKQKYHEYLDIIRIVGVQIAPQPGHTLKQCLPYITKQKVYLVSCDTFTNYPLNILHFDDNLVKGVILMEKKQNIGYFLIKQQNMEYIAKQNNNDKQGFVYIGLCCLSTKQLIYVCLNSLKQNEQYYPLKKVFMDLINQFKVKAIQFIDSENYFININRDSDLQMAASLQISIQKNI